MDDIWHRFIENFLNRLDGPMHFRFIAQPLMAIIFATLDGLKDARACEPAYFWSLFSAPELRGENIKSGFKSVGKVFIVACVLDLIYQTTVQHWIYPFETLFTAFLLAIVPYVLLRGLVNRVVRGIGKKQSSESTIALDRK